MMRLDKLINDILEEEKKYREGFGYRRDNMYENELKDLADVYRGAMKRIEEEIHALKNMMLPIMKEYVELNEEYGEIDERLQKLLGKINRNDEGEEDE